VDRAENSIQLGSTLTLMATAIAEGRTGELAELATQLLVECEESHELFPPFVTSATEFLQSKFQQAQLDGEILAAEQARLDRLLALPDGSAASMEPAWAALADGLQLVQQLAERGQSDHAIELLEQTRFAWQQTHDRYADLIYGLLDVGARHLGESIVGPMWDAMMADFYRTRDAYALDQRPWSESFAILLEDSAVSLRGHLSGPGRRGEVEMIETADRVTFRFDPCGSGGRTMRPEALEDGVARMDPPYGFGVTTEAHDWAWGANGVCLYCVHCCQLQERIPIERIGFPVRVVDPPIWDGGNERPSCTWTVYRDPSLVPAQAYQRVGFPPPAPPAPG
jgi:hypothetical protein